MSKIQPTGSYKINDLVSKLMHDNQMTGKQMATNIGVSAVNVSQFLNNSKNPWVETVLSYFKALEDMPVIVDENGAKFHHGNQIVTMNQLHKKVGNLHLAFKNGDVYQIIQHEDSRI